MDKGGQLIISIEWNVAFIQPPTDFTRAISELNKYNKFPDKKN